MPADLTNFRSSIIDTPRKPNQEDLFGIQAYQDGLVDYIKFTNTPITIALQGEWGSGKTFVMEMLEETFNKHSEYLIVKYDAWKNNFYSEPLIAILSCVIDAMQEKLSEINGFQEVMKAAGKETLDSFLKSNKQAGKIVSFIKVMAYFVITFIACLACASCSVFRTSTGTSVLKNRQNGSNRPFSHITNRGIP